MCTGEDFVKEELFFRGLGTVVCICVRVLRVLSGWRRDVVRRGARVFLFKVGLQCSEHGVRVCCDFVSCGVPDCLQVGLVSRSRL